MSHRSVSSFTAVPAAVLAVVLGLAGCSSGTTTASSTSSAPAAAASAPASSASAPVSSTPSAAETVAGGGATTFCAAFKELESLQGDNTNVTDLAAAGTKFRAVAADIRATAPASIKAAANTYADLIDNIGEAAQSGSISQAGLQKAFTDAVAGKAADIGSVAVYVAKSCPGLGG
ncbi:MAG TPA: hypothetical protein VIM19_21335 [Actinomycetes bacterium]